MALNRGHSPEFGRKRKRAGADLRGTFNVCIVGAGPAGLAVAGELAAAGRRFVVLESGAFAADESVQALNDGEHEGVPYDGLMRTRHRRVGGTANLWNVDVAGRVGAKYTPLSARDMRDWPFGRGELEPYYVEAQALCGLGPFEYGAEYWRTEARAPWALEGTGLESRVYQFGSAERLLGNLLGRVRGEESGGAVLASSVTAVGLMREGRRVVGVRAVSSSGQMEHVRARAVVLAAGAIENARLLLLDGEGEESAWLGRGFMEHARDFSLVLVPLSAGLYARSGFYDLHAGAGGHLIGGHLAATDESLERLRLPGAAVTLVPRRGGRERRGRVRAVLGALRGRFERAASPARYGWSRVPSPERVFEAFDLVVNIEQRPRASNRVELGRRRDRLGNPLPRLVLEWSDEEQAGLERLRGLLAEAFIGSRLGRLQVVAGRRPDLSAHHHAGTTRMAKSPIAGVVDAEGRVFGRENLYVAGASVFPSAGFANPTLTVVALGVRLGRELVGAPITPGSISSA